MGSPVSPCRRGQQLIAPLEEAYQHIYQLLGASPSHQLLVTGSAAEGVSQIIHGTYQSVTRQTGKNHVVVGAGDDAPAILALNQMESMGMISTLAPLDGNGQLTPDALIESLSPRTALLSLSWAHPLTGVIQPIEQLLPICQERGVQLHLEATHMVGKCFFEFDQCGADFLTFNGPQLHGPPGVGGLLVRTGRSLPPLVIGGEPNVPGTIGLGVAAREGNHHLDHVSMEVARLRDLFEERLCRAIPTAQVLFQEVERVPTISCIAFSGVSSEALLYALNRKGVAATFGGGCQQRLSLVLESCGFDSAIAHSALSFCLSRFTTEEELLETVDRIGEAYRRLQKVSAQLMEAPVCP